MYNLRLICQSVAKLLLSRQHEVAKRGAEYKIDRHNKSLLQGQFVNGYIYLFSAI